MGPVKGQGINRLDTIQEINKLTFVARQVIWVVLPTFVIFHAIFLISIKSIMFWAVKIRGIGVGIRFWVIANNIRLPVAVAMDRIPN